VENPNVNKELPLDLELCLPGWPEEFGNNEEIDDALDGLPMHSCQYPRHLAIIAEQKHDR
jgi:hypothetical protein